MAHAQFGAVLGFIRDLTAGHKNSDQTDSALLRAFQGDNDHLAFEALLRRHGPMVLRVCQRTLGHVQESEDAFQATFLLLAQQAASIRKQESLASWLHGVAFRMATRAKRAAARRRGHESRANQTQTRDPGLCAAWQEIHVLLDQEIERLPQSLRGTFIACCLENKSCAVTARQLGVEVGTIWKRLGRARKLLQVRLTRRGVSLSTVLAAAALGTNAALAAVPRSLVCGTVKAAAQVASGQALAGVPVSANVLTLVRGVNQAMFLGKCKTVIVMFLLSASVGIGFGWGALRGWSAQTVPLAQGVPATPGEGSKKQRPQPDDKPAKGDAKENGKGPAQAEMPTAVRQALERNVRAFAPIALTVEKQRSASDPQSARAKQILGTFPGFLKPCTYEYLAQDDLCYARYNQWVQGGRRIGDTDEFTKELMEGWQEFSWDGTCAYLGNQSLQPKILEIVPLEKVSSDGHFKIVSWYGADDYFEMIGITVPRTMMELPEGRRSEVLRLLEGNGKVTSTTTKRLPGEAADFLVVELLSGGKKHRFWLDPSRGHAVRRKEVWDGSGALEVVIDNSDFIKLVDPELWLPRHCHVEWYAWRMWPGEQATGKTTVRVELQATRLERTRVPQEQFTLKYGPGSYISDARLPAAKKGRDGRIDYIVPKDPAHLKGVIRAAEEGTEFVPPRRPLALWIISGGLALFAAVGVIVLIRQRRRRSKTPEVKAS